MDSTRLHGPATPSAAPFPAALPGAARHSEGPASRRQPDLRLVWSADRTGNQPARAPGPAEAVAPHRGGPPPPGPPAPAGAGAPPGGAPCRLFSPAPAPTSSAPRLRERWVL